MSIVKDLLLISLALIFVIKYIKLRKNFFKQKEYFIQTLNHDLRVSTIAQLRGLELLEKKENNSANSELISYINDSCRFTLEMISTLLNTYRFEKGEQVLNCEPCNINSLIQESCNSVYKISNEKNIKFKIISNESFYPSIDKNSINKLLLNLISTSIIYSEKNGNIYIHNKILSNNSFNITIGYKGKALTEEEGKRMFSNNSNFSTVGQGIRMHLCKKIVDFHQGKIKIKNLDNNINHFEIILPIQNPKKYGNRKLFFNKYSSFCKQF